MNDDTRPFRPRESSLSDTPTGQLRAPASFGVEAAGRTDKGRVRSGNEDAFGLEPPTSAQARAQGTLLIVSDGMGGHAAGEVASGLAVETVKAAFYREHGASTSDAIRNAIATANSVIFNSAEENVARSGMGCTIVVMVVQGSNLTVGHVGDSRGYLIRGGRARQLTRDHSWVAMQVEEGILTPEQAEHHPNRSLLMRALGRQPSVEVEIGQHQVQAGDVLLLCSDGLTGVVNDAEIGEYASRYAPATAADQLVNLANQRGAPDNVTVLAAAITGPAGGAAASDKTVTMAAPPADALTPRLVQPLASTATTPILRNPAGAGAPPTSPTTATTSRNPAAAAPPAGTPIVLARESAQPRAAGPARGRRGRGRWLAGSIAAFGLAAGLVLLTTLGPRTFGGPDLSRAPEPAVASKPAATSPSAGQAAPAATVPPPVATGIPAPAPTSGAAIAAAPPPPAAASSPAANPAPAVSATSSAASKPGITPLVPGIGPAASGTPIGATSSPPALIAPPGVTQATPTPAQGSVESPPRDGVAGPSDANAGAGAPADGAGAPADAAGAPADGAGAPDETAPNPDAEAPGMAGEPEGAEPPTDEPEQPAPPQGGPPAPGPRFTPPAGFPIPGGLPFRPGRKPSDD